MITSAAAIISFISLAPFGPGGGLSWFRRGALVRAFVGSRRVEDGLSCLTSYLFASVVQGERGGKLAWPSLSRRPHSRCIPKCNGKGTTFPLRFTNVSPKIFKNFVVAVILVIWSFGQNRFPNVKIHHYNINIYIYIIVSK